MKILIKNIAQLLIKYPLETLVFLFAVLFIVQSIRLSYCHSSNGSVAPPVPESLLEFQHKFIQQLESVSYELNHSKATLIKLNNSLTSINNQIDSVSVKYSDQYNFVKTTKDIDSLLNIALLP